jgi:hypothetical protein
MSSHPDVFTSEQKPGKLLLVEGRYSVELDALELEALRNLNRAERRRYLAEHRTTKRLR